MPAKSKKNNHEKEFPKLNLSKINGAWDAVSYAWSVLTYIFLFHFLKLIVVLVIIMIAVSGYSFKRNKDGSTEFKKEPMKFQEKKK